MSLWKDWLPQAERLGEVMTLGEPRDRDRQSKGTVGLKWGGGGGLQEQNGNGNVSTALPDCKAPSHTIQFICVIMSPCAFHSKFWNRILMYSQVTVTNSHVKCLPWLWSHAMLPMVMFIILGGAGVSEHKSTEVFANKNYVQLHQTETKKQNLDIWGFHIAGLLGYETVQLVHLAGTFCHHLQGGSSMFLQNNGTHIPANTAQQPNWCNWISFPLWQWMEQGESTENGSISVWMCNYISEVSIHLAEATVLQLLSQILTSDSKTVTYHWVAEWGRSFLKPAGWRFFPIRISPI
jgi:hypothetical protein